MTELVLEIIEGPNGVGVTLNDTVIAGAHGGGVMHAVKRWEVDKEKLKQLLEREDDNMQFYRPRRANPIDDGWICPYCGKRVYSMEVHPCNQPYC